LGTAAATGQLYQPRMIGDGDCGEIGGMMIGKGNRSTRRKPAPAPLCSPPGPPRWEASDYPLKLWRGLYIYVTVVGFFLLDTSVHVDYDRETFNVTVLRRGIY
jgi:hypothetical protein